MSDPFSPSRPEPGADHLRQYLDGSASAQVTEEVEAWLEGAVGRKILVQALRPGAGAISDEQWNVSRALEQMRARQTLHESVVSPARTPPRRHLLAFASVLGLIGLLAVGWWRWPHRQVTFAADVTHTARNGEQTVITLSDGTHVRLNVASQLHVPREFGTRTRTVYLEGEAQFIVRPNPAQPFVVRVNGTQVRDLATEFVVRGYAEGGNTIVAVREGRVAVQSPRVTDAGAAIVDPSQVAVVSADGTTRVERENVDRYFAWTSGTLMLLDVPAGEALAQLSRWYDLEFRVTDSALLRERVTLSLPQTLTRERLDAIAALFNTRAEQSGRIVTLVPVQ